MITSKQNALIKEVRSLLNKKYRAQLKKYIVEGIKMVNEAIALGQKIHVIICTEKCFSQLLPCQCKIELVSEEVYNSITDESSPQGVMAVLHMQEQLLLEPKGSCLILDGVSDPGNLGTIIRTMACAGYKDLYLTEDCADAYSPKAVRSSMSGIYHVNVMIATRQQILKVVNLPIVVADMGGEDVYKTQISGDFCLVIGNEAHGVSLELKSKATKIVKLSMQKGMESLNASVCAGILMYTLKNNQ